ncbi:hypothetical protein [Kitasatospora sp. NPDC050543]|uniref:hypothetical protein n=1 Tax=Kitasatospora sp. NPDC050543 TaxID=3364054 RepID=UPI0037AD5C22
MREHGAGDEDQEQPDRERQAVNELLADAAQAGRRAAGWVRELAERQPDNAHRVVLYRAAAAVELASGREVVPGGDGQLAEELAYDLAANVVTGSPCAQALPELGAGERVALVAVCTVAAAMPGAVLGELERELPALAATMEAATEAGRAARPNTGDTGRTKEIPSPGETRGR